MMMTEKPEFYPNGDIRLLAAMGRSREAFLSNRITACQIFNILYGLQLSLELYYNL